jgi:hypothetical protein
MMTVGEIAQSPRPLTDDVAALPLGHANLMRIGHVVIGVAVASLPSAGALR